MKINIIVEIEIDGDSDGKESFIRENFLEWFDPDRKLSPTEYDDEWQAWIRSITMCEEGEK